MDNSILRKDIHDFANHFELAEEYRNSTFLITGATGLIGSILIKCLAELNSRFNLRINIISIIRDLQKARIVFEDEYQDIEFIQIPISEISNENIQRDIDYIIHLASPTASKFFITNPVETLSSAFMGTKAVLNFAKMNNVRGVVYASSLEVYGSNHTDDLINEDFQGYVNPIDVRSSYSLGKRVCECLCRSYAEEYQVPVLIARLTQTFGAGVKDSENRVFAQFARSILSRQNIELHTEGSSAKPYCYTLDAVSAILYLLLRGKKGEAYNIANKGSYISIRDMALFLKKNFNPEIDVVVNVKEGMGYAPETRLRLDTRKIESLGWKPHYDLEQMFRRLIEYMK